MKKQYEKPMMSVERFALTQTIANCATKIGFGGTVQCVASDADSTWEMKDLANSAIESGTTDFSYFYGPLASDGKSGCTIDVRDYYNSSSGNELDGICYHTNANTAFLS